jgi:hypothetical protein
MCAHSQHTTTAHLPLHLRWHAGLSHLVVWCGVALQASTVAVPLLEEAHGDFEAEEFNQVSV